MPLKNKTRFAILGLLSWKPMSGYDLKKLIEIGLSYFWSESYGQLYPTLEKLVAEGLAVKKLDRKHPKRPRHLYTVTPKGRRAFERWLREPSDMPRARNEHQLKFFLSCALPFEEGIRVLREYRAQQQERYELYLDSERILSAASRTGDVPDEIREVLETDPPSTKDARSRQMLMFLLTLRHGILAVEARLAWCDEALEVLGEQSRLEKSRPRGAGGGDPP